MVSSSSTYCIFVCLCVSVVSAMVKHYDGGSMSSNSGQTHLLQQVFARQKKASFYINSQPSQSSGGAAVPADFSSTMVDEHNKFRRMVSSTNMQLMTWDQQLATSAQAHANQCVFGHTDASMRTFGENIYASPWNDAPSTVVRNWFDEAYKCQCTNGYNYCCGHYTQVVWAETNKVGCGVAYCGGGITNAPGSSYLLVCQYTPTGNTVQFTAAGTITSLPAFDYRYKDQSICSTCPSGSYCNDGLCDVK